MPITFAAKRPLLRSIIFALGCLVHGCVTARWSTESESTLRFEGYIDKSAAEEFFKVVTPSTRQIIVTSGGGDAATGFVIAEHIFSHKIDIVVEGYCASSCANYFFLAANRKTVRPGSWLGFHGGAAIPKTDMEKMLSQMSLTADQRAEVTKQFEALTAKQNDFFNLVPGGDIVATSQLIASDARVTARARQSGYPNLAWLPSKEELETAGVKNINSFWFPSSNERTELSKKHNGLLLSTEDVTTLK